MESRASAYYQQLQLLLLLLLPPRPAPPPLLPALHYYPPLLNEQKRPHSAKETSKQEVGVAFHGVQSPTQYLLAERSLDSFLDSNKPWSVEIRFKIRANLFRVDLLVVFVVG
jgi:hypothetical protein